MSRKPAPPAVYSHETRHDPDTIRKTLAGVRPVPYWIDTAPQRQPLPALEGHTRADLTVVGGGYCGLWTALQAKERDPDRDVVLLEGKRVGWAASGRNGGFCEASLTHGAANRNARFPAEADTIADLEQENFTGLRATLDRYGMDVQFEDAGVLAAAAEPHQVPALRAADAPPHARFLTGTELGRYVSSPVYRAGLFKTAGYALVNPALLAHELRRVCLQLGVRIHENTPARRIRRTRHGITVHTRDGAVHTRKAALATNGFPTLLRRTRHWTLPVYDYALVTQPLTDDQLAGIGWTGRHGLTDSGHQFHYSRKTADNRILWGGYDAVYHRGGRIQARHDHRPRTFEMLADHFLTTFPSLADVRFTHAWGGMIDMSTRLVSTQGTVRRGDVAYSLGYTGLGVAATRFGAAVMLDMLDDEHTPRTRLELTTGRPFPVPPEPLAYPIVQTVRNAVTRADARGRQGVLLRAMDTIGIGFDS